MIPSTSGTIKTNYIAFGHRQKASKQEDVAKKTAITGGATVASAKFYQVADRATKTVNGASKCINELGSRNVEHVVDKTAVVRICEKIFGHSKLAKFAAVPLGGGLVLATTISDSLNMFKVLPKISIVKDLANKN